MNLPKSTPLRLLGTLALALYAGSIIVHGASSTNFELDMQSTPGAGGDSFSTSYHLVAMAPQTPAGELRVSANYQLETIFVPDTFEPVDTTPPVIISGPFVAYLSDTTALIEWETDEPADGSVEYGLTTAYGSNALQPGGFSVLHQVLITGLAAGVTYDLRVNSTDPYSNGPTQSANAQFTTQAAPDNTGPLIAESVTATSTQSVEITFTTNEAATSNVEHGTTPGLGASLPDAIFRTSHARSINGLTPGATLFYEITAADPAGNGGTTGVQTFALPLDVAIDAVTPPDGKVGNAYFLTLTATGGAGPLSWALESGTLPPGLTMSTTTGEIAGTPAGGGTFDFAIRATDSGAPASTDVINLQIRISRKRGSGENESGCSTGDGQAQWAALALVAALSALTWRRQTQNG